MAAKYKFKPYQPKNLPSFKPKLLDEVDKTKKSLVTQKRNLEKRLLAEGVDPENLGGEFDNRNILEKALNLTPDQGLLMDFFEVINRPVEAVKGAIVAGMDGESFLQGAWEGVSGEKITKGSEVLDRFGVDTDDNLVANIATDIVLDPLTYVPAGILIKGGKKLFTRTISETVQNADVLMNKNLLKLIEKSPINEGEDIVAYLTRIAEDGNIDTVFKPGQTGDYLDLTRNSQGAYKKSVSGLKERVDFLKEVNTEIKKLRINNPKITNKEILKQLKKTAKIKDTVKGWKNIKEAVFAELEVYERYADILESVDPDNIKVVMTGSEANRLGDIVILKRYGDTEYFVKIDSFEAKKLGGAEGPTFMPMFDDSGNIVSKSGAFQYSDDLLKRFDSFMNTQVNGRTIKDRVLELYRKGKVQSIADSTKQVASLNIEKLVAGNKELSDAYKKLIFDMFREKGITTLSYADPVKGGVHTLTVDAAEKYSKISGGFDITPSSSMAKLPTLKKWFVQRLENIADASKKAPRKIAAREKHLADFIAEAPESFQLMSVEDKAQALAEAYRDARKQFRFRPSVTFDEKSIELAKEAGDILENDDIVKTLVGTTEQKRTVGIIEYIGKTRKDKLGQLAASFDSFIKKIQSTFNLTYGFSGASKIRTKQILGESIFELERRSARLASIKKRLIEVNPNAGEYLSELIESGAYLADGNKIVTMKRRVGTSDFLDYARNRLSDNVPVILPKFASEADKINFVNELNSLAQESFFAGKDFKPFSVVEKGKGTKLVFDGSLSDMDEIIQKYSEKVLIRPKTVKEAYLNFGQARLSKGAKDLLRSSSDIIQEYQRLSDDILQELIRKAGFDNLPAELSDQIGYMRHIMTKEAYEGLQKTLPMVRSRFAKAGKDTLSKRTFMGSIVEINEGLKEFSNLTVDLFDKDAFNAMEDLIKTAQRKMEQHQMLGLILEGTSREGSALFRVMPNSAKSTLGPLDKGFTNFKEEFSALYKNLSPKSKQTLDSFLALQGATKDTMVVMNESAYNVLKNVEKAYIDLPPFVKTYDKFLNTWKGITLLTPGFHMRNLFGNTFNSYAAGMDMAAQGRYATIAYKELSQYEAIIKKIADGADLTMKEQELFDLVKGYFEQGVSQTHRGIRDLEQLKSNMDDILEETGRIKSTYNNLIRLNFNFAEKMDDFQRYMLYRWSLDKTGDAAKAARTVSETLFDYTHLTPFEKEYMKRLFPFYTFMKNNFIFQAKNIFRNPRQYARAGRAYKYAVEDLSGYTQENLPDYMTENMWIPIPMTLNKDDKEAITLLKSNLPLSDFTELVENPFKKGVVSLTAPVKLLIEFGAGRDMFTGKALQAFPGEKNALSPDAGVLSGIRDSRGNLTITQSPLFQKIMNDLGLRAPINFASVPLDLVDTMTGYQGGAEGFGDFLQRLGVAGTQNIERLELSKLYEDLERLRELKKYYEQETRRQLPVLPRG